MTDTPKLYVGTYGKYNNGSIAGKWLDLTDYSSNEEFYKACAELHSDEKDPEYMFQDYEYLPKCFYSESGLDARLWDFVALDEDDREKVSEYLDEVDSTQEDLQSIIDDYYEGNINDMKGDSFTMSDAEAYGYHMKEQGLIEIPDHLESYFDFEKYGKECLYDATITESGHIFRNY